MRWIILMVTLLVQGCTIGGGPDDYESPEAQTARHRAERRESRGESSDSMRHREAELRLRGQMGR